MLDIFRLQFKKGNTNLKTWSTQWLKNLINWILWYVSQCFSVFLVLWCTAGASRTWVLVFITAFDFWVKKAKSQCLKRPLTNFQFGGLFLSPFSETLIPHNGWLENPLPWLSWLNSNPLIVCNQTEKRKVWSPPFCPPYCQKQQVARILRFFTLTKPWLNLPGFPPAPEQRRSCCFPPLHIRFEGHCEMPTPFHKALIYSQHPAISRCHWSIGV